MTGRVGQLLVGIVERQRQSPTAALQRMLDQGAPAAIRG